MQTAAYLNSNPAPTDIEVNRAIVQQLDLGDQKAQHLEIDVLRLDRIHPVISGNKWFKLKYHIQEAIQKNSSHIITYGGPWSNHIVATARITKEAGLQSTGIIRGERPKLLSHTLLQAMDYGMNLQFLNRNDYAQQANQLPDNDAGPGYVIPQGGAGLPGIKGCTEILDLTEADRYSHIMCCIGTGTMFTGLAYRMKENQHLIGIPVLKGFDPLPLLEPMMPALKHDVKLTILPDYHFGGYAKQTPVLIEFMNNFYQQFGIPTDFVYTAKLMYAAKHLVSTGFFPKGSRILLIHSGGLQGNASLAAGTLIF